MKYVQSLKDHLRVIALLGVVVFLWTGCSNKPTRIETEFPHSKNNHINSASMTKAHNLSPLQPVTSTSFLPQPIDEPELELYTVVVNQVPLRELLFSLSRDAKINVDIDDEISDTVSLNAIDQTLPQILDRISEQAEIRYEIHDRLVRIKRDKPFIRTYKIDYLNMSRDSSSSVNVSTELNATGGSTSDSGGGASLSNNNSASKVNNLSYHHFWESLTQNISTIIADEQVSNKPSKKGPDEDDEDNDTAKKSDPNIIINKESGIIGVRTTYKKHRIIEQFIAEVINSSQRQVLIEATIAEITLLDKYQSGIDWSLISIGKTSANIAQSLTSSDLGQPPFFSMNVDNVDSEGNVISSAITALKQFGDVQVMSSPKIMTLNNQTALLKVVDNIVYFNLEVETVSSEGAGITTEFETTANTIPVGFVMSVTPFISEFDEVTLNVRPTISRVIGSARDPNPELARVNVVSEVPVIQVREVESILKIKSHQTAVIGGLMQDKISDTSREVPYVSKVPWLGELFKYKDDELEKTELVIFIRPIVIQNASLKNDLKQYQQYLPSSSFQSAL